jgi:aminopeptidase N
VLLSNGNPVEEQELPDGRTTPSGRPAPQALLPVRAGRRRSAREASQDLTTVSGREVELEIWVRAGRHRQVRPCARLAEASMRWDEERFGREYDLDMFMIVAVSDFNMGAMENKGLNVFNSKYVLASPRPRPTRLTRHRGVIAHEYFHNWTGNRITCRDWFQLCLKEG